MADVIRQRQWSEDELKNSGFRHYQRKKELVMARRLSEAEAPQYIRLASGEQLIARAGSYICYEPGDEVKQALEEYEHWPVEKSIFEKTYKPWDEPDWTPTPPQKYLMDHGCAPYYKVTGIWAKELEEDIYLQSLEHIEPVLTKSGRILAIGVDGEPYSMRRETLKRRYVKTPEQNGE